MSFSQEVKEELLKSLDSARHCRIAELSAYLLFLSNRETADLDGELCIKSENTALLRKCFTLLRKTFNICIDFEPRAVGHHFEISVPLSDAADLLQATGSSLCLKNSCCKRAFLKGAYLSVGSMSDPARSYHLEFVCNTKEAATAVCEQLIACELCGKLVKRRNAYIAYIKEGTEISTFLSLTGACVSLMNLENTRILKEIGNNINRQCNCESANMAKSINTSTKQKLDVQYISEHMGLSALPEHLRIVAELRLEVPEETSLKDMAAMLNPPLTKSGLNHRLQKLTAIADELRQSGS